MASIQVRKKTNCLIIDFYYRGTRCREQTALDDTAVNRKKVQKLIDRIEADIAACTFDYSQYFPSSKNVMKFDELNGAPVIDPVAVKVAEVVAAPAVNGDIPMFRNFTETWFMEKEV